jgi:PAS domain S-box-containing protein
MNKDALCTDSPGSALPDESFESLYEDAPCGYCSTLPDGRFLRVNRTLLAWTGYRREELLAPRAFRDLLTTGGQIFHETHYAPLLSLQGSVREIALEIVRADRTHFSALINSVVLRDESGRPRLIRTVIISARERRSYERELLAARERAELVAKTKTDFVSMLSHDLRTPLSAVACVADVLQSGVLTPAQHNYLRLLKSGADSLMALLNDVLDNSKLESGKMKLELHPLNLSALVWDLVERLRLMAESKGLQLTATVDHRIPPTLLGDAVKLSQIFTNLIGNAIKFTDEGWVGLTVNMTAMNAREVRITASIADTGIGLDPARLDDIFEEFTQGYEPSVRSFGGAGLGLAISKKLVLLHGGSICAKSRDGGGSLFEFSVLLQIP